MFLESAYRISFKRGPKGADSGMEDVGCERGRHFREFIRDTANSSVAANPALQRREAPAL
jgi:hypothetical protein